MVKDTQKYVAEFLGTMTLVLIGCGSAVIAGNQIGFAGIAFAFGLTVLAMVYAIGPISGCHINPAISIAMLVAGKMKGKDCLMYIIAQCLGAIVGAALLLAVASGLDGYSRSGDGLGQNGFSSGSPGGYDLGSCFLAEVLLTFVFLMVIFGSTSKAAPKGFAGVSIGFSLVLIHLVGIPITGTSVNPARSLGPALLVWGNDAMEQVWLFIVAPVLGAIVAALVWKLFFDSAAEEAAPPAS
jgi:aquaporin Z